MTLRRAVLLVPDAREILGNKKYVKAHTLSHLLMNTCPECGRKLEKRQGKPTVWVCPVHGEIENIPEVSPSLAGQVLKAMDEWSKYTHGRSKATWVRGDIL